MLGITKVNRYTFYLCYDGPQRAKTKEATLTLAKYALRYRNIELAAWQSTGRRGGGY